LDGISVGLIEAAFVAAMFVVISKRISHHNEVFTRQVVMGTLGWPSLLY